MRFLYGLKEFLLRGNVVDMGIGIIIGTAFSKIVQSFVSDIVMPPIGLLLSSTDFSELYLNLSGTKYASLQDAQAAGAATINVGLFIETLIHFLIVAFAVYLFIIQVNKVRNVPIEQTRFTTCSYCYTTISSLASRCPNCTSNLNGTPSSNHDRMKVRFK
ncbi:large conductance mechanosensitive channel protein MscL [Pseudalkalibacillus berkeleyi]|uniref:Large-conductance mechanosensitive channel n=1 Tax=Pseudalkalibacillus berkeleyi TaxID=1069813 RepID=A0ABS9H5D7_9BACL|nr:large conductance mechanosensitive channel protein MscL [Pseudalkalibacillus berkeleyi]MCF6139025.1 large conductance mechanosensitive channel protein MscL [Pseudalkalibacillus berkeleyi]